jgi:hypothetical protein
MSERQSLGFIFAIVVSALLAAFLTEALLYLLQPRPRADSKEVPPEIRSFMQ